MAYPNCYNCVNVKIKQPYCEPKCMKDSDHHCQKVVESDGSWYYGGIVVTRNKGEWAELTCKDYKFRKGEINYEESLAEKWDSLGESEE